MASMVLEPHIYQDSSLEKDEDEGKCFKIHLNECVIWLAKHRIGIGLRIVTVFVSCKRRLSTINVGMNMMIKLG